MPVSASRHVALAAMLIWPPVHGVLLEQHDGMAALGADARRFQPAGAAADDHDALLLGGLGDDVRHGPLAAGGGVLDAERVAAGIDAVDAVAGADALADVVDPAFHQLADKVRVGDVGAGHGDHVDMALRDRAAGGVEVGDALGVEDRDVHLALDGAGEEQEGRHRERHVRQHDGVGQMVARLPAQHVDEVDQAALRIGAGDGDAVLVGQAVVDQLVAGHAHADDVVVADRLAAWLPAPRCRSACGFPGCRRTCRCAG